MLIMRFAQKFSIKYSFKYSVAVILTAVSLINAGCEGTSDEAFAPGVESTGTTTESNLTGPTITSITFPTAKTYVLGENVDFIVNTSSAVSINTGGGSPRIHFNVGGTTRYANLQSTISSTSYTFRIRFRQMI